MSCSASPGGQQYVGDVVLLIPGSVPCVGDQRRWHLQCSGMVYSRAIRFEGQSFGGTLCRALMLAELARAWGAVSIHPHVVREASIVDTGFPVRLTAIQRPFC
eukprot:2246091-Amphidinium_carterae.1